jgi:ribosomal protein L11 methyltransferase
LKHWSALHLQFPVATGVVSLQDLVAAALDDLECQAVEELTDDQWRVHFRSATQRDRAAGQLEGLFRDRHLQLERIEIEDEDWARRSQASLKAVRVGRVVVAPPWDVPAQPEPTDIVLIIEPSTGFGSGHHASTRLCLAALQTLPVAGSTVVDVGTGSGVLALAAARLGARQVVAFDVDEDAVAAAREAVAGNHLTERIALSVGDLETAALPRADIVLANLTGAMLAREARRLLGLLGGTGTLVLGGITVEEDQSVQQAFCPPARVRTRTAEDGWVGLVVDA